MNKKLLMTALAASLLMALAPAISHAGPKGPGGFAPGGGGGGGGGIPPGPGGFAPGGGGGGGNGGGWGGGWGGGFGIHITPGYGGHYQADYGDDRISCGQGKRVVRDSGYRNVRTLECRGSTYTYRAKRGSRTYNVSVDAFDGFISGRNRL